jgi:hypothetical protein
MTTTYRLARQTSRWCRFATVTVEVTSTTEHAAAVVAQDAEGRQEHRLEAAAGARYALARMPADYGGYQVTVTNIQATDVDTGVGDVHEATARAVWQAVDVNPRPAYAGFSEPEIVAAWLHDRIGLQLTAVTEARHWYHGERDQGAASLVHAWLHFDRRPPTQLHGHGDDLLLSVGDAYPGYGMDESGEIRVDPATAPDLLAGIVGKQLTNAAVILGPFSDTSCAGLLLQMGAAEVVIGTYCDEWIIIDDPELAWTERQWRLQPWIAPRSSA